MSAASVKYKLHTWAVTVPSGLTSAPSSPLSQHLTHSPQTNTSSPCVGSRCSLRLKNNLMLFHLSTPTHLLNPSSNITSSEKPFWIHLDCSALFRYGVPMTPYSHFLGAITLAHGIYHSCTLSSQLEQELSQEGIVSSSSLCLSSLPYF